MSAPVALLDVIVVPRASRTALRVEEDGAVRIWVTRPPAEGQANRAILEVLADALGCPLSSCELAGGVRSRHKRVRVRGLSADEARTRLSRRP